MFNVVDFTPIQLEYWQHKQKNLRLFTSSFSLVFFLLLSTSYSAFFSPFFHNVLSPHYTLRYMTTQKTPTHTHTSARPSSLSSSICCRQLVIMKSIIKEKSILLITCCLYLAAVWCVFCVRACIIIYLTLSLKVHWLKMMKKKIRSWKQKQLLYNDQAADSNSSWDNNVHLEE